MNKDVSSRDCLVETHRSDCCPPGQNNRDFAAKKESTVHAHSSLRARHNWNVFSKRLRFAFRRRIFEEQSCLLIFNVEVMKNTNYHFLSMKEPNAECFVKFLPPGRDVSLLNLVHGFDNTGNIRVWPGSEALAWVFFEKLDVINGETFLELGAGFLGLTSFLLAKKYPNYDYWVTDGNMNSVESLKSVKLINETERVTVCQLLWGFTNLGKKFTTILAADCVFFDQFHQNFLNCLVTHLERDGVAYICCPERKGSLRKFRENVEKNWKIFKIAYESVMNSHISEKIGNLFSDEKEIDENFPVVLSIRFRST